MSQFSMPSDWPAQIEKWTGDRGPNWRIALDYWLVNRRHDGRIMQWSAERFYEMIHLWNDQGQTAVGITRWWIDQKIIPYKNDPQRGFNDGTGHRGVVDGMARRMQRSGILDARSTYPEDRIRNAILGKKKADIPPHREQIARPPNRTMEILEMRRKRVENSGGSFDNLSREERGMPPPGLARQQHPNHPPGVTYDAAFRMEHGRTTLFSVADRNRLSVSRRFFDIVSALNKSIATDRPSPADYESLTFREKDLVHLGLRKILPEIKTLIRFLESLPEPQRILE